MKGRDKEIKEIIIYERVVEVVNLMLGKRDRVKNIFPDDFQNLPRQNLRAGKVDVKSKWPDVKKFYRDNFKTGSAKSLAKLYEPLHKHNSKYRIPLTEFIKIVGEPHKRVIKGAPLHSTVSLSSWGLQFEYPEMHLIRDLALAYNAALKIDGDINDFKEGLSMSDAKKKQNEISEKYTQMKFNMRMCLICCFNLVEAYINGLAWEFVYTKGTAGLSNNKKKLLEGDQTNILEKLLKIPGIITKSDSSPLDDGTPPLSAFREIIKPYRDSIVHASPYLAPEKFGGYDRLSNIYDLDFKVVNKATDLILDIISRIHQFVGGEDEFPGWVCSRNSDGFFEVW